MRRPDYEEALNAVSDLIAYAEIIDLLKTREMLIVTLMVLRNEISQKSDAEQRDIDHFVQSSKVIPFLMK